MKIEVSDHAAERARSRLKVRGTTDQIKATLKQHIEEAIVKGRAMRKDSERYYVVLRGVEYRLHLNPRTKALILMTVVALKRKHGAVRCC